MAHYNGHTYVGMGGRALPPGHTGEVHTRSGQLSLLPIGRQTSTC